MRISKGFCVSKEEIINSHILRFIICWVSFSVEILLGEYTSILVFRIKSLATHIALSFCSYMISFPYFLALENRSWSENFELHDRSEVIRIIFYVFLD